MRLWLTASYGAGIRHPSPSAAIAIAATEVRQPQRQVGDLQHSPPPTRAASGRGTRGADTEPWTGQCSLDADTPVSTHSVPAAATGP